MLALGLTSGRVMVVDEATGEVKWAVQAHSLNARVQVAMSPNGRFVASVGFPDVDCKIWDAASGKFHRVVATHNGADADIEGLSAVAFSPCGQRLATRGSNGAVILWDVRTGQAEHRMQGEAGHSTAIAFSADGARVASGTGHTSIDVFDATTGAWLRTIEEEENFVLCVSFSPTAISMLATATPDDAIHVWDIGSGELIREIARCSRIAIFSPDGRTIATSGPFGHDVEGLHMGDVLLIDADSGEMRFRMVGHTNAVWMASWSVDGSKLASGGGDGTCKVWDSTTGALLRTIEFEDEFGDFGDDKLESVAWGRDWVWDTRRAMAFAMGQHPRLGAGSRVLALEAGVVRMILDRV